MKKIYLSGALALLTLGSLAAQSKLDPATRMLFESRHQQAEELAQKARVLSVKEPNNDGSLAFIVELNDGHDMAELENLGATVTSSMGSFGVIEASLDQLEDLANCDAVKYIAANYRHETLTNLARQASNVDAVHNGAEGLPRQFRGKGVILGVIDTGIEPMHANFCDDMGEPRVKRMWHFTGNNGTFLEYADENLYSFTSDNGNETHGTHVAGIMGGSFNEMGTFASLNAQGRVEVSGGRIPFYGMAPEADMVLSGGELYDANIVGGVHKAIEYARSTGQPIVINLSLGSTHGPHDGTDVSTAALSDAGREAIVCVASGNDGSNRLAVQKTLSEYDTEMVTFLNDDQAYGAVDIWGDTDKPFKASWGIFDSLNLDFTELFTADNSGASTSMKSDLYSKLFTGTVTFNAELNPRNNRWHVYTLANVRKKTGAEGRYWLGIKIEGAEGQRIDIYGNTRTTFTNNGIEYYENGTYDGTVNGMSCGKNMISVGSYTTRSICPNMSSSSNRFSGTYGDLSYFSSWGHLADGRTLPHVCAPGEWLASSFNTSYVNTGADKSYLSAKAQGPVNENHWGYLQGTSMACPAAAGIIALWLEACPTLTVEQVIDIINKTSVRDEAVKSSTNPIAWGAGKIDALAGIKEALKYASVVSPAADGDDALIITDNGESLELFIAGVDNMKASLYNMQGACVAATNANGDTANLATSQLDKGVYIVTVESTIGRHSRKVAIR